jgi:hypothetical protein
MSRSRNTQPEADSVILDAINLLTEELNVLRIVIDEMRDEMQWKNQNPHRESDCFDGRRIQSFSLDPTRADFQVNSVPPETVERLRSELAPVEQRPSSQAALFR